MIQTTKHRPRLTANAYLNPRTIVCDTCRHNVTDLKAKCRAGYMGLERLGLPMPYFCSDYVRVTP